MNKECHQQPAPWLLFYVKQIEFLTNKQKSRIDVKYEVYLMQMPLSFPLSLSLSLSLSSSLF